MLYCTFSQMNASFMNKSFFYQNINFIVFQNICLIYICVCVCVCVCVWERLYACTYHYINTYYIYYAVCKIKNYVVDFQ